MVVVVADDEEAVVDEELFFQQTLSLLIHLPHQLSILISIPWRPYQSKLQA